MAKYMVLYNSDASASELMANATPEEMKASMGEWIEWANEAKQKIKFDFGLPLQAVNKVTPIEVTKSENSASGYSTLEGEKDTILELLKTHPHLKRPGASIDVLEMLSMPGIES